MEQMMADGVGVAAPPPPIETPAKPAKALAKPSKYPRSTAMRRRDRSSKLSTDSVSPERGGNPRLLPRTGTSIPRQQWKGRRPLEGAGPEVEIKCNGSLSPYTA